MPPATTRSAPGSAGRQRLRGSAFGLQLDADFAIRGLSPAGRAAARTVRLELVSAEELDAWPVRDAAEVRRLRHPDGSPALVTRHHPRLGWLMVAPGFGRHAIAPDGSLVRSAPAATDPDLWQLVLVGQVLPAAAVLSGLEALHASAVGIRGRAVAFAGPAGAGKSTLAAHLALRGAEFMTDDVLALEMCDEGLTAHRGIATAAIRRHAFAALRERGAERHGHPVEHRAKVALSFRPPANPLPLGAIYFLERAEAGARPAIEPFAPGSRRLLGSAFGVAIRTPQRMLRQLSVCARIAAAVPAFRLRVPCAGEDEVAPRLLEHALAAVAP